ncbi:MAG: hypothetical protein OES26_26360, partial [Gammaproteobacteria bacterium]|nr:hypothetical protein [Gammaproteobacteria bacterium]
MNAQYELGAYYYREANQGIDTAVELTDAAMGLFKPEVPKEEPPGLHTWATIHYRYPSARLVLALRCRVIDTEDSAVLSESKLQSVTGYRRLTWWAED